VTARGWQLAGVNIDNDISALTGAHRPGYAALLASVQRGELDRIVAYGLSRLWRSRTERAEAIVVLSAARIGVALVRGSDLDLTSAAGRMYAGVLGEFDTAESEINAERVARAAQQRAEEGRPNGALGYGWHRVHERDNAGRLTASRDVEDPAEAEVVRSIVADLLAGTSIKAVTASPNLRDLPRPTGQAAHGVHPPCASWHCALATWPTASTAMSSGRGRAVPGGRHGPHEFPCRAVHRPPTPTMTAARTAAAVPEMSRGRVPVVFQARPAQVPATRTAPPVTAW